MIQEEEPTLPSPETFMESLQQFSFQEKYFKWIAYLKEIKQADSQYYQASL